jgi:hypothetical protein
MEHRWGERVAIDIPVRLADHPFSVRVGRLSDLSVSGARIKVDFAVRLFSRLQVIIESPQRSKHEAPVIAAYVTRKFGDGIGVEWCEFAPHAIGELLRSVITRRYTRARKNAPPTALLVSRFSAPLLKHRSD